MAIGYWPSAYLASSPTRRLTHDSRLTTSNFGPIGPKPACFPWTTRRGEHELGGDDVGRREAKEKVGHASDSDPHVRYCVDVARARRAWSAVARRRARVDSGRGRYATRDFVSRSGVSYRR